jgi:hypothetical protein
MNLQVSLFLLTVYRGISDITMWCAYAPILAPSVGIPPLDEFNLEHLCFSRGVV